jgi:hypothetical protein
VAITNTFSGTIPAYTSLTVTKKWKGFSPSIADSITVELSAQVNNSSITLPTSISTAVTINMASGTQSGDTGYNGAYTWSSLPKYYKGEAITYKIKETVPLGFNASYSGAANANGEITFTNDIASATIANNYLGDWTDVGRQLEITKIWAGDKNPSQPSSVSVNLTAMANGSAVTLPRTQYTTVNIFGESGTQFAGVGYGNVYKWTSLPEYYNGYEIVYYINETTLEGNYSAPIYGGAANENGEVSFASSDDASATITNTFSTPKAPKGEKVPDTGDHSSLWLWISSFCALLISLIFIIIVALRKRRVMNNR